MNKLPIAATALFLLILLPSTVASAAQLAYPSASWNYAPLTPRVGDPVTFDASDSLAYWAIVDFDWDFADGTTDSGAVVTHVFTQPGEYWVGITVTDNRGYSGTSQMLVTVADQTPVTVYLSLSSERVYIGEDVTLSGNLTYNGDGVPRETIIFSTKTYADSAGWVDIGTTQTDASGVYKFNWHTQEPKGYRVRAMWAGNSTYTQSSISRVLYVISYGDLITGFQSNSTITGLNFNMTTRQLKFNAAGPGGTSGYVNITLQKSSLVNPENLTVLLDNQPLQYSLESAGQTWNLHFVYTHSTHDVLVDFTGASSQQISPHSSDQEAPQISGSLSIVTLVIISGVLVAGLILGLLIYLKKNH
ncbi:MAG: PKD domain-containing protein [Candidatus Bathyarchaeota archaeon]|nr:PKD domain-containing protein [Candidatus Bathyarchaeota archaeon]